MNYQEFVMNLNKGLPRRIIAYDEQDGSCVLLTTHCGTTLTVTIPSSFIEERPQEVIRALREDLRSHEWASWHIKMVLNDTTLALEAMGQNGRSGT